MFHDVMPKSRSPGGRPLAPTADTSGSVQCFLQEADILQGPAALAQCPGEDSASSVHTKLRVSASKRMQGADMTRMCT